MGYSSRLSGDLTVRRRDTGGVPSPATLAYAEVMGLDPDEVPAASPKTVDALKALRDFSHFYEYEEGWDGVDALLPTGEPGKAYSFREDLEGAVALLAGQDLLVDGTVLRVGEDGSDVSRYIVTANMIVEEAAKVVLQWPDGSTEPLPGR